MSGRREWPMGITGRGVLHEKPAPVERTKRVPPQTPSFPNAKGVAALQPRVAVERPLPWDHVARNDATLTGLRPVSGSGLPHAGTALRFNDYAIRSQGGPHSIRPTLGWRP